MQRLSDIMTTNRTGEKGKPHSQHVEHTSTTTPATPVAKPESAQADLTTSGQAGQPAATSNPADIEVARTLPPAFEHEGKIDAETAKYLDSSVIIDDETNRQIKHMLDRRILPFLVITYFFQTFDKGTLAFSSVMGIQTDTHLVGQQYALLGTILYIGILVGEGILVCLHAACKTWSALMAVRFLLGLFESLCVAGLLAFGLTYVHDAPIYSWQALFIIVGGLTVIWGVILLIFLPDSPMKAKVTSHTPPVPTGIHCWGFGWIYADTPTLGQCWDDRTKTLIIERLRVNELGVQDRRFKWEQMWEALKDPVVWVYLVLQFTCFLITNGLSTFSNIIVKGMGFSTAQTQLLNLAQGGWSVMIFVGSAWLARVTKQTCLVLIGFMLVAMAGTIALDSVAVTSKTAPGLLIAFYFANFVIVSGNLLWSLLTRNVAGQTKKVTVFTLMFVAYALGAIIGPQIFQARDAPRYHTAFAVHIALYAFFCVMAVVLRLMLMRRNHLRRKQHAEHELATTSGSTEAEVIQHDNAFADLTDLQNTASFRYMY
ncbi:hypothetical protein JCM24511_09281 [Saitozyma sp. JCM 24511]|nr:hypothetical protein JCM24511_09281 [Saitozyma sp. JCM 24511]